MSKKDISKTTIGSIIAIAIISLAPTTALANSYENEVRAIFTPPNPVFSSIARIEDFEHAWAHEIDHAIDSHWSPATQLPGFDRDGTYRQDENGTIWNSGGPPVLYNFHSSSGPWPYTQSNSVEARSGANSAKASSMGTVDRIVATGAFSAYAKVEGYGASPAPGSARAFSATRISMLGLTEDWRQGTLEWQPSLHMEIIDPTPQDPQFHNPITVSITDNDDNIALQETIVDMWGYLDAGNDAELLWDDGTLSITNAEYGELVIDLDSEFINPDDRGYAHLVFEDGIITESTDSGVLEGILPDVGTPSDFSTTTPDPFTLRYDIPDCGPNLRFDLPLCDDANEGAIPEPSSIGLLALSSIVLLVRKRH